MTGLQAAWEAVERDGWEVVWLGRRLGRPHPRRWLAQAIRYRPSDRRAMAWGETAVDALVKLADEIATLATLDSRKPVVVDERHDWRNPPASLPSLAPRPVEATTTAGVQDLRTGRAVTAESFGPRKVYVAESGLYEQRMVVGIYDSPERAIAAHHEPGMTWTKTTWTSHPNWPDRSVVTHWVDWVNDRDWDEHVRISEQQLVEAGELRQPDVARIQAYRESDGGWDYLPERATESVTSQSPVQTSDLQGTPTEGSDDPRS